MAVEIYGKLNGVGQLSGNLNSAVANYTALTNKPKINGVELVGDKSLNDIGAEGTISSTAAVTSVVDDDYIPKIDINDAGKTKKITWANIITAIRTKLFSTTSGILKSDGSGTISAALAGTDYQNATNSLIAETSLANDDTIPFYDASAVAHRKSSFTSIKSFLKTYFDTIYTSALIKLSGYTKASSKTSIAATDSVNTAIGKLEAGVDGNSTSISTLANQTSTSISELKNSELQSTCIVHPRLPNGAINTFENGSFVERVKKYTLQASDLTAMLTTQTNVDIAYSSAPFKPDIALGTQSAVSGKVSIPNHIETYTDARNDASKIGMFYLTTSGRLDFIFAKGTTLAQAQAALTGTVVYYQLATPNTIALPTTKTPNTQELVRLSEKTSDIEKKANIIGTGNQISITENADGNPVLSIPTGATGLMRPASTNVVYGSELAPSIDTWVGDGGANWNGLAWVIPNYGTLKTSITVEQNTEYQIDITWTNTNAYDEILTPMLKVSLGTAISTPQFTGMSDALYKLTMTANETGVVDLKLGNGIEPWSATISNVSVKRITSRVSAATKIGVGVFDVYTGDTNFAVGGGHAKRTSGICNTAIGYLAQNDLTTGQFNNAFGMYAQQHLKTGLNNVALGYQSQFNLDTGYYNIGIGYCAQSTLQSGSWNVGIGNECQRDLTTGHRNTAIGSRAMNSLTTGNNNVAIGRHAGFVPKGNASWATTTGNNQVILGMQAGQCSAIQSDNLTAIGYQAVGTTNATAIGAKTEASGVGSVAIGIDSEGGYASTTTDNEIKLGTALHTVKIIGKINLSGIATTDPHVSGQIWSNSGVLSVSAGG